MLQIRSFNRLENWLKKVVHKKTKLPRIDAVRRSLSDFDLDGLKGIHNDTAKTTIENNAFHQLKTEWHLDHDFLHSPTGVEKVFISLSWDSGK